MLLGGTLRLKLTKRLEFRVGRNFRDHLMQWGFKKKKKRAPYIQKVDQLLMYFEETDDNIKKIT